MVDLETLGVEENAVITSIGAVRFNPRGLDTEDSLDDVHYVRINPQSAQAAGCTIDASTVLWWMQQTDAARSEMLNSDQLSLGLAIDGFAIWCHRAIPQPTRIWAKGYDFDVGKLRYVFNLVNQKWPFHFAHSRCVRTIEELADPTGELPPIGVGVAHNALDDARRQVLSVQRAYRLLGC